MSQYKTLLNIQYATKFRRWVFDATAQLNGPARIPTQTGDLDDSYYSPRYPMFFAQVSRKVGKFDIYAGCENIADYRQKDPILNAQDPYDYKFNSMNVWGPLMLSLIHILEKALTVGGSLTQTFGLVNPCLLYTS